ncbi:hypothetical protein Ancab_034263 [Ancistrocladus abbreviatus]
MLRSSTLVSSVPKKLGQRWCVLTKANNLVRQLKKEALQKAKEHDKALKKLLNCHTNMIQACVEPIKDQKEVMLKSKEQIVPEAAAGVTQDVGPNDPSIVVEATKSVAFEESTTARLSSIL